MKTKAIEFIQEYIDTKEHLDGVKVAETKETTLLRDMGIDSIDVMEITMNIEHENNVRIPDNVSEECDTLEKLIKMYTDHVNDN